MRGVPTQSLDFPDLTALRASQTGRLQTVTPCPEGASGAVCGSFCVPVSLHLGPWGDKRVPLLRGVSLPILITVHSHHERIAV